ncbi:hypothetical protein BJ508DRAFT_10641 [Ascobolus immersus RN42]|uniref:Uncharacterized protein n=1 Tax=Ascobolus immersus RN42 TaxID=1160509 RepID=A0A3N4HQS1_ASCIM|nr:hypothetical protein BJ508DRAFT_10641 [Ascobolus immersus RN42]
MLRSCSFALVMTARIVGCPKRGGPHLLPNYWSPAFITKRSNLIQIQKRNRLWVPWSKVVQLYYYLSLGRQNS